MRKFIILMTVACYILSAHVSTTFAEQKNPRRLSVKEYVDKMKAGWIGQMAGVGWGAPTEFRWMASIIPEDKVPEWMPKMINQYGQDDLYVEMTFLRTLELYGIDASIRQAGIDFANSGYRLFEANRNGRENLRKGIAPPDSGHPKFNGHSDDIDYQIEADYAGLISPGMPNSGIQLGEVFGRLMNYGDGLYGGQFVAGMYAEAFFETDMEKIVRAGLACVPEGSQFHECITDVLKWHKANPDDWKATWQLIDDKYHKNPEYRRGSCESSSRVGFNIDAKINAAYIVVGMLYGEGDPDKTIIISMRCGQDSDCNPSSAAGVLFTSLGLPAVPERFVSALDKETKFSHTPYTYPKLVEVCSELARQVVIKQGGRIEKDEDGREVFLIPVQKPRPSALEQGWEAGPIANSRFTEAEMVKIIPPPVELADVDMMARAVKAFAPGWGITDCGNQMSAGLHEELAGKKNVLETHPISKSRPCVLYRHVDVPQGKTVLHLTVGHHKSGDWNLIVVNGKIKTLLKTTVGSENSKDGWMNVDIDLSEYAGSAIDLALLNSISGGFFEAGYWAKIEIVTQSTVKAKTEAYLESVWAKLQAEVEAGNMTAEEAEAKMIAIKKDAAVKMKSDAFEGQEYELTSDSLPQEGVPKGAVTKHTFDSSEIYPGTTHEYWVYVPAQYKKSEPACVMVFQDGAGFVHKEGSMRAPIVFDNLIHKGEIPVTIGIFINPGKKEDSYDQRETQYVPLSDTYARFLLEEILPEVGKDYNLVDNAAGRAVCGMSDGGVCSFTVVWERPDAFSKVISHIGSYTRLRGGSEYPYLIRKTRGNPKPIRVFLQDGADDINIIEGNWTLANINMASALMFARYDYRFEMGPGGHELYHGGAIFPDTLRWIWRDYPGVKGADDAPDLDAVIGQWDVVTNVLGRVSHSVLTIAEQDGELTAKLIDEKDGELKVTSISFEDGILSYAYAPPQPKSSRGKSAKGKDAKSKDAKSKDAKSEGTKGKGDMMTWLKVTGNTFEGALSRGPVSQTEIDFSVRGQKKGTTPDAGAENPDEKKHPIIGTWELTSEWEKGKGKGKHIVSVNPNLTGTVKDLELGWTSKLRNVKSKGDAVSFSFFFGKTEEYEIDFEGTVVDKEIKGEFTVGGATAVVVGTPLSAAEAASAAARPTLFEHYEARSFTSSEGDTLPYRLFVPQDYNPDKQYPIVLFHHGGGATGRDNRVNLEGSLVREWIRPEEQAKNPCFIVAPQFPGKESRSGEGKLSTTDIVKLHIRTMHEILDSLEEEFSIDTSREYVTGLSWGGECVWLSVIERPARFAAAVPICATDGIAVDISAAERGKKFAQLPLWIFHGDADDVVPVDVSRKMVKALRDAGGNPKYTEYPGVRHGSWDRAYREPELIKWLFAQSRTPSPR